jgi:hypothetical protein
MNNPKIFSHILKRLKLKTFENDAVRNEQASVKQHISSAPSTHMVTLLIFYSVPTHIACQYFLHYVDLKSH